MTTIEIFSALRDLLAAVKLEAGSDEPLFEAIVLHPNKRLLQALRDQLVTKDRVCLVVPLSVRRLTPDTQGAVSVSGRKFADVVLIYTDRALFRADQSVTFGSDQKPGLFALDDLIETALLGKEVAPELGGIVLGDSDPLLLSDAEQKSDPGRHAWMIQLLVPTGFLLATA